MATTLIPSALDAPRPNAAQLKAEQASQRPISSMTLPELPHGKSLNEDDDPELSEEERQTSDYLTASLILQQQDHGFWGMVERATEKLADVTEKAGDAFEHGADHLADDIENSHFVPKGLRDGAAKATRGIGSAANRGAHAAARGERGALAVEHAMASGDYFKDLARHESGNNTFAKAKTSSATGLYQFTKGTWLGVVSQHGGAHSGALAEAAQHIHKVGKGYKVDAGWEAKILDMRKDPQLSTAMAQDFTNDNAGAIQRIIGNRPINNGDLYIAHFLGPAAAAKMIIEMNKNPNANAAELFPDAANANKNIFYTRDHRERTVQEVYALQTRDFMPKQGDNIQLASAAKPNHAALNGGKTTVVASNAPAPGKKRVPGMGLAPGFHPPGADA